MTQDKKYGINYPCSKCGERGASSKYYDGWPSSDLSQALGGIPDDFEPEEKIIRKCLNCGYSWQEDVL